MTGDIGDHPSRAPFHNALFPGGMELTCYYKLKLHDTRITCSFNVVQVCFTSYYVVDSGLTAVATGGRTLAQYQGRGISAKVKAASLEAAKVNFPDLRTEALTAIDAPFYDRYRTPNPQGVYISYERVGMYTHPVKGHEPAHSGYTAVF